jgi:hypothetical protein
LKGQSLSYFHNHLRKRVEAEDSEIPENELIELVLRGIGLEYIPKCAIHIQKYYMRQTRGLHTCIKTSVQQYSERLNGINRYLLYFPEENPKQLDQNEIIEILDRAKVRDSERHEAMVNANIDIFEKSNDKSYSYFKQLENLEKKRAHQAPTVQVRLQYQ